MSGDRKKPGVAFWATVVVAILLLLAAYEGPYYGTARVGLEIDMDGTNQHIGPHYASNPQWNRALTAFFAAAHWIDKKTMPAKWNAASYEPPATPCAKTTT